MLVDLNTVKNEDWLKTYWDQLVQRVQNSRRLCKALLKQDLISEDEFECISAARCSEDRMQLILQILSNEAQRGRDALYHLLQEHEPELTLQLEHSIFVHGLKSRLIQEVRRVEPVAKHMVSQGLIKDQQYLQICKAEGSVARMKTLFRVLEQGNLEQISGFYSALFHSEPLLYRQLEKERILQTCRIEEVPCGDLEQRIEELVQREKQVEKELEEVRRERETLNRLRSEVEREKEQVAKMKKEMEKWWKTKKEMQMNFNSEPLIGGEEGQSIMGHMEDMNSNSYSIAVGDSRDCPVTDFALLALKYKAPKTPTC